MSSETQASSYLAGSYTYNADGQRVRRDGLHLGARAHRMPEVLEGFENRTHGFHSRNASIIFPTSAPRGYNTGHVQPAFTYSLTFSRHSSGVPVAGQK